MTTSWLRDAVISVASRLSTVDRCLDRVTDPDGRVAGLRPVGRCRVELAPIATSGINIA